MNLKKYLLTTSCLILSSTAVANSKFIIFGDSLSDTGSDLSSQVLEKQDKPATNGGEIDGKKLSQESR